MDLDKVFAEIDADASLSEQEKLDRKAKAIKAWREIHGIPAAPRTFHHKNKTSVGGTFGRSVARSLGSQIIRALFRGARF